MINLFDNFDNASRDLLISQKLSKIQIPTVVINDNGFLPAECDSPIQYFCKLQSNHRPMYFDQVPVPHFWRIQGDALSAQIYDMKTKRADIHYIANDNTRIVNEVNWLDENGQISWTDHYDNHATHFATTYYDNGQPALKNYYNLDGKKVIEQNLRAGDIFLHFGKIDHHFPNIGAFVRYYLKEKQYQLDHVFYNTLNLGLNTVLGLPKEQGEDVLFWHEKLGDELPGNMKLLMDNETRTKHIVFQNYEDWATKQELLPKENSNVDFQYLGMIYPHPRGNSLRPQALIVTSSDQIHHLKELVTTMPKITFHIAAITEMSDKLMAFDDYDNVNLYPVIGRSKLMELMKECDIYLDINEGNEVLDATRGAFEQNMLILGFKGLIHEPKFVANENVYEDKVESIQQMNVKIMSALVKPEMMKELIDQQRKEASDVWPEDYQRVLGALMNG